MTKSKTNWPSTQAAEEKKIQKQLKKATSLVQVGELFEAASAVKMPVHEHILNGVREAQKENSKVPGKTRRRQEKAARRAGTDLAAWNEVNAIALACSRMVTIAGALTPILSEREVMLRVKNRPLLIRLVNSLVRDTRQLANDYKRIYARHENKSDLIKSDEDMMEAYSIFTDYVNFTELSNSSIVPTMTWISEMLVDAMDELSKVNPELVEKLNYASVNYEFIRAKAAMDGLTGAGKTAEEREAQEAQEAQDATA